MDKKIEQIKITHLPSQFVVNSYIDAYGNRHPIYERYMVEFINNCSAFISHFKNNFTLYEQQSNSEADCFSYYEDGEKYELDFKLLSSQSFMEYQSIATIRKVYPIPGLCMNQNPKTTGKTFDVSFPWNIIPNFTCDELYMIKERKKKIKKPKDVIEWLKIMETKKNILLFFPFCFTNASSYTNSELIVNSWIPNHLQRLFEYRETRITGFDTYFSTIVEDEYLLFQKNGPNMVFIDSVKTIKSPTYSGLI